MTSPAVTAPTGPMPAAPSALELYQRGELPLNAYLATVGRPTPGARTRGRHFRPDVQHTGLMPAVAR